MKRFKIQHEIQVTIIATNYVFADSLTEAEAHPDAKKPRQNLPKMIGQAFCTPFVTAKTADNVGVKVTRTMSFQDNRLPYLIKLEGKQVDVTWMDEIIKLTRRPKVERLWVTPVGEGVMNPLNEHLRSTLSLTRRWDCEYMMENMNNVLKIEVVK